MSSKFLKNFKKGYRGIWKRYSDLLLIFLLVSFSIFPRIWELRKYPPVIVDEPANLRDIRKIITSGELSLTGFHWDFSKSQIIHLPTIFLIKIMGDSNEFLALRLTSAILSILAVIAFFLLAERLTNQIIAFISSLLFSFSYYFLQFSRVGWTDIVSVVTAGLFLFWVLQKAQEEKRIFWIILGGILGGLIFYSYRGGLIYILVSFLYLPLGLILEKLAVKKIIAFFSLFAITFLIVALPWMIKVSQNSQKYNLRYRVVSIKNVSKPYHGYFRNYDILKYQIITSIKSWLFLQAVEGGGHENPRYLPGIYPPVNLFVKLGFWIGFFVALLNLKKNFHFFLVLVLGIYLGQILTVDPPNGARGLVMLPIIYILFSLALNKIYEALGNKRYVLTIFLVLSLIFSFLDFKFYQFWMGWIRV